MLLTRFNAATTTLPESAINLHSVREVLVLSYLRNAVTYQLACSSGTIKVSDLTMFLGADSSN